MLAIWLWERSVTLVPLGPWSVWPGRALILAGLALAGWAVLALLRARTPLEPRRTPTALVTGGAFRLTRNPIYRGLLLIVAGWAVASGELTSLAFVAAYGWVLWTRFVLPEEVVLRTTFGPAYDDWARRTPARL